MSLISLPPSSLHRYMSYWSGKLSDKWNKISKKKENHDWFHSLGAKLYERMHRIEWGRGGARPLPFGHNCLLTKHMEIKWARLNSLLFITYPKNCIILHWDKTFLQYAQIFAFTLWTFELFWHFLQTSEHPFKPNCSLLPFNFFML